MIRVTSLVVIAALMATPVLAAGPTSQAQGRHIAARDCGACHAIGQTGPSPISLAPPFRALGQRYEVDALAESLAEGISVGHPMMPVRVYSPGDIRSLLAYLRSLQPARPHLKKSPATR
jgi:cytochrome c